MPLVAVLVTVWELVATEFNAVCVCLSMVVAGMMNVSVVVCTVPLAYVTVVDMVLTTWTWVAFSTPPPTVAVVEVCSISGPSPPKQAWEALSNAPVVSGSLSGAAVDVAGAALDAAGVALDAAGSASDAAGAALDAASAASISSTAASDSAPVSASPLRIGMYTFGDS